MIPKDSPIRNPPAVMPDEQKVAFDGLRYTADMLDIASSRLHGDLLEMSHRKEAGEEFKDDAFARCFADTWSLIDNFWRFNLLLLRVPGLKRTPNVVADLKEIRKIEIFRHGFQHLDGRVKLCARDRVPLLGTIAWVHFPDGPLAPGRSFSLIPGAFRPGSAPLVNPRGQPFHSAIDYVTVTAFGESIDVTALLRRVNALVIRLDAGVRAATSGQLGGGSDFMVSVEIVPNTTNQVAAETAPDEPAVPLAP